MKRILALLLAMAVLLGMTPYLACRASAAEDGLEGMTISILGDGISTFAGVSAGGDYYRDGKSDVALSDTWWQQAIDTLGLRLLVNNSASGAYILGAAGAEQCVQLHSAGEDPDIIAVFLGTNDFIAHPAALGTADIDYETLIRDNGDGTFTYAVPATSCEAYAITLHRMTVRYADARIVCMTLLPRPCVDGADNQPTAFNASLAQIAGRFGCTVVDLENCGIPTEPKEFNRYMADAWTHPNAAGMDLISGAVFSALLGEPVRQEGLQWESGDVQQTAPMVYEDAVLPEGYIRVAYLDSLDGAYIDTRLSAQSTDKFVLYASALTNTTHSLMGSGSTNTANDRVQVHYIRNSGYTLRFLGDMGDVVSLPVDDMVEFTLDLQNGKGYINGKLVLEQSPDVLPTGHAIYLFTKNISQQIDPSYTDDSRIYAYRHYRNGILVRDMVPCYRQSDGEYGMYDLVGKKFYTNAGGGALCYDPLDLTGGGAIVMDMDTGKIIFGKNIHWQHAMASITKIMTCVLALENLELDDRTPAAISSDLLGGSTMGLSAGESLTVLNALYGLMLPSGNDVAQLIARTVSGDYATFVAKMNARAAELGLTNTRFCNASGLADEGLYTTVYDMTKLMRFAMQNETFRKLVATKTYQVKADGKGGKAHSLTNTNQLLGTYEGCIGGKTSTTTASGAHLVAVAERNGVTILAMILGSDIENRYSDTIKLLDYGFENVHVHDYTAVVTAPTCTQGGYTTHTCAGCGDSYRDTEVDALGHDYVDGVCTRCGDVTIVVLASGTSGDLTWKLTDDGILTFSGTGAMADYTSKTQMPWYGYSDRINGVVVEEGAVSIGDYAFYGMDLASLTIAQTVTSIGAYAFKNASLPETVALPDGLTQLGESAFYGCGGLTSIDIPAGLWTVQPYTFKNCTALEHVTFHEGNLQKIADGAFYNTGLTAVELPDCLQILDAYVFKNCAGLSEIRLSAGLTEIREASLYGTALSQVSIPEGVTVIRAYAFKNCAALESVALPGTLTGVGEAAFYACTGLKMLALPDAVTEIGSYAFRKCTGLTGVAFGSGLEQIGESAFYGCTGLTALELPEQVNTIGAYAFKGCTGVASLALPDALVTMGDSAFHSCTGIGSVTIPAHVASVGEYCFSGSTGLRQIAFTGDAPAIGTGAFNRVTATATYPGGNTTWTADVMQHYGGTITWLAA